jgi:hypothetical protein
VSVSSDNLTTADILYSLSESLGAVSIDPPTIPPVMVSLGTMTGLSVSTPEDTVTVAPQSFPAVTMNLPPFSNFTTASVASGQATAYLNNNLGCALDTIILEIWDTGVNALIAVDSFATPVPSGSSVSIPLDFSASLISNRFRVIATTHTPGGFVTQVSTRGIEGEIVFAPTLTVVAATAEIPAFGKAFSQQVSLVESDRIDTASLSAGTLSLTIGNQTNLGADLIITMPDLVQGGTPLTVNQSIAALQTLNMNINLAGYDLVPLDVTAPQDVAVNVTASILSSAPNQVAVNQADSFYVSAGLTGLAFGTVIGVFAGVDASFDNITETIDVPTGFDSLELASAVLTLQVENSLDLPGTLDVLIDGSNGKNLAINGVIQPSGALSSATSTITNSTVADFFSPIPDQITITGSVTFGDGVYQGRIEADDYVFSTVSILAPLELLINPSTVETDIERTAVNQEDIDIIADHVIEARFIYNLISALPVGAEVSIFLGTDSAALYSTPQLEIGAITLPAAPVDGLGIVTDTISTGFQQITLDSADFQILKNDTLFVGQELVLAGSGGQTVKLTQNDSLTIIGRLEVEYNFDGEF